jgi:hypothetical protein
LSEKGDSDTMLEGRSAAFSVGIEKRINQNVNSFKRDIVNGESNRQKAFEKLEGATRELIEQMRSSKEQELARAK